MNFLFVSSEWQDILIRRTGLISNFHAWNVSGSGITLSLAEYKKSLLCSFLFGTLFKSPPHLFTISELKDETFVSSQHPFWGLHLKKSLQKSLNLLINLIGTHSPFLLPSQFSVSSSFQVFPIPGLRQPLTLKFTTQQVLVKSKVNFSPLTLLTSYFRRFKSNLSFWNLSTGRTLRYLLPCWIIYEKPQEVGASAHFKLLYIKIIKF